MTRRVPFILLAALLVVTGVTRIDGQLGSAPLQRQDESSRNQDHDQDNDRDTEDRQIKIGFEIAPVPLNLRNKNRDLVGLGSYLVNAVGDCAGCHSNPQYAPGGDPHLGQPAKINKATYLSGGGDLFGPFVPRNLTPNSAGLPAFLTLEQFLLTINTGADLKHREPFVPSEANDLLQIMPWPVFAKMTLRQKRAIYEYLRAIPCIGSATRCGT